MKKRWFIREILIETDGMRKEEKLCKTKADAYGTPHCAQNSYTHTNISK